MRHNYVSAIIILKSSKNVGRPFLIVEYFAPAHSGHRPFVGKWTFDRRPGCTLGFGSSTMIERVRQEQQQFGRRGPAEDDGRAPRRLRLEKGKPTRDSESKFCLCLPIAYNSISTAGWNCLDRRRLLTEF
eukprot:scaffold42455_cov183-Amphora_coffeaeformis.AAC.4